MIFDCNHAFNSIWVSTCLKLIFKVNIITPDFYTPEPVRSYLCLLSLSTSSPQIQVLWTNVPDSDPVSESCWLTPPKYVLCPTASFSCWFIFFARRDCLFWCYGSRNHIDRKVWPKRLLQDRWEWLLICGNLWGRIDCDWSRRWWHKLLFLGNCPAWLHWGYLGKNTRTHHKSEGFLVMPSENILTAQKCLLVEGSCSVADDDSENVMVI